MALPNKKNTKPTTKVVTNVAGKPPFTKVGAANAPSKPDMATNKKPPTPVTGKTMNTATVKGKKTK